MCNMENKMKMIVVLPHSWNHFFYLFRFLPLFSFVQRNISYDFYKSDLYIPNEIIFFLTLKIRMTFEFGSPIYDFLFFSSFEKKNYLSDLNCGAVSYRVDSPSNHFRHFSDHMFHAYLLLMCFIDFFIFNVCDRSFTNIFEKHKTKTCSIQTNALQLQSYFHYRIQTIPNNMKLAVHSVRHNRIFSKKNHTRSITCGDISHLKSPNRLWSSNPTSNHHSSCYRMKIYVTYFVLLWQPEACDKREYFFIYIVCQ